MRRFEALKGRDKILNMSNYVMHYLTITEIERFLQLLKNDYRVLVPIVLPDGTRSLGKLGDYSLALAGGALPMKPSGIFSPYLETLLRFSPHNEAVLPQQSPKPLLVVGFTAQDLACLEFVDRFFSTNYYDEQYFAKRKNAVIVGVSGKSGKNGEMLKIAGNNCDLELIGDGEHYFLCAYSKMGKALIKTIDFGAKVEKTKLKQLRTTSKKILSEELKLLHQASKLILHEKVPDSFWEEIAERCIACTACTLTCPTCTCFDVFDRLDKNKNIERIRLRDSCQLDGFMREASGHNPMGTRCLRTRRRIHHKLAADVTRWGHITCYLCGRCDDVCPTNIGIKSVCKELVARYA